MRKYLFQSGLFGAITGAVTLLRGLRSEETFTWRTALAWLSWGISLALAIGAVVDARRASQGKMIDDDSRLSRSDQNELLKRRLHKP